MKKNCGAACPARLYRGVGKLYTTKAREVFLIGERNEHDHDSLNIDCLKR